MDVTPCVGVWIETAMLFSGLAPLQVTPCVGVWIETSEQWQLCIHTWSHPAWVCGLKLVWRGSCHLWDGHTLRGCVDWNFSVYRYQIFIGVTPCVGVWIETRHGISSVRTTSCHTLRGCVDWNGDWIYKNVAGLSHTLRGCVDWN